MKKLSKAILLSLVAILVVGMPVLAAVSYRATYTIVESDGNPYDMLAVLELADNQWMADNGFMSASALDTRIETLGGSGKPHMVATNKTLTAVPVPADSQTNLYFTTANPDLPMDIIAGYNGYITITDDGSPAQQTLELGDDFEIEIDDAYIDTSVGGSKYLVDKEDAFQIFTGVVDKEITAQIIATPLSYNPDAHIEGTSVDGYVQLTDLAGQTWDAIQGATDGTSITDDAINAYIFMRCDTDVNEWDQTMRSFLLFDTSPIPASATILSATLKIKGSAKVDGRPWNDLTLNVFSSNPASDDGLVIGDYDQVGITAFATPIAYADYNIAGWNTFTLNDAGLAAIDTAGITKFSIREATYDAPDSEPTWSSGDSISFTFFTADSAGNEPILEVTYAAVVTAINVESGPHDIETALSTGTFSISIDSAGAGDGYDSVAFAGNVPSNDNDWLIMDNSTTDFMPYMGYYKHTVGGVEHAWYQPNYMVEGTDHDGVEDVGGSTTVITDATITDAPGWWVGALVTITEAAGALPEGESRVCTVSAAGGVITVAPAFSDTVDFDDEFTIDFGTLIDRSYYGIEFDAVDDIIACGAAADMDITDEATLTAWVYIDSDGENSEGSIIDRRDATPDGYRLYVSSEAGVNVAIEAILDGATDAHAISNVEVSISGWHYIVAVYNRLGTFHWEIYEDGVLLGLTTDQAGVAPITGHTANVMNIGDNAASDRCFDGRIDEPSFYTTAWTQALVTANYNAGVGLYTPTDTTSIALQLHMEEGTGAAVADTSGEANNGTITNAVWVNGKVPRPAGNAGTNDSRLTWGANPTGVAVTLGGMVSAGQPVPGSIPTDPAQDILPETEVTDWFIEPAVGTTLLNNPLRPFVIMMSGDGSPTDTNTLTEIQAWRILALAIILLITVATAISVGRHQGITAIMAGVAILGAVVLTIFPMWALVFAIGMFIGGLVMERAPSL